MATGEDSRFDSFLWLLLTSLNKLNGFRALWYLSSGLSEGRLRSLPERHETSPVFSFSSRSLLESGLCTAFAGRSTSLGRPVLVLTSRSVE